MYNVYIKKKKKHTMLNKVLSIQENGVQKYLTTTDNYQTLSYSTNPNDGLIFEMEIYSYDWQNGNYYWQEYINHDNYTTHIVLATKNPNGHSYKIVNYQLGFEDFNEYIYWTYGESGDSHRLHNPNTELLVQFHDPNNLPPVAPLSTPAACFLEGTKVLTDQGPVSIEKLTRDNTIFGCYVNNVTKSHNFFNHLIHFKKNAIVDKVPSIDTYCTPTHAIYCPTSKKLKMAKEFCDGIKIVEDYTKDVSKHIYNVIIQDDKGSPTSHAMYVNNMLCESLHPNAYESVRNQLMFS